MGDRLRESGLAPHEVLLTGRQASEIIEHARTSNVSLVVLGAHSQTGLDKMFLGSTTLEVLTHCHASVLVAREPTVPARGSRERPLVGSLEAPSVVAIGALA